MGNNKPEDGAGCTSLPNHITHRINTAFLADELDAPTYNTNEYNFEVEKQKIDEFVAGQSPARLDELVDYGRVNGGEFRDAFLARPIEEQIYFMRQVCRARHANLHVPLVRSKFYRFWAARNHKALMSENLESETYEPDAEGLYIPRKDWFAFWDLHFALQKENKELEAKVKALEYSLKLDEDLIGMIQKVITVLNNRPVQGE